MAVPSSWLSRWRRKSALLSLACLALFSGSSLPLARAADKTAADYFIHSLPGAPDGPLLKMHAGHIEVSPEHHGHLFFWHYQNRHLADRPRTVIWLNGGPGCSSEDGGLMEIGPYRVKEGGKLEYNDGSWDEFANVLFVDNPVGTGFSYVDTNAYVHELKDMADQFVVFLEKWFALFPDYMHDDIYIAGESYAGQHIPYIARAMLDRNKQPGKESWNLKGLLIGNGWISPVDQYLSYMPFAKQAGLLPDGSDAAKTVETQHQLCIKKLNDGGKDRVDTQDCEDILQEILRVSQDKSSAQSCVNMYDVRLRDTYPSCGMNWPPDLATVTPYLRRDDVVKALHIDPDKKTGWTECNGAVGGAFTAAHSAPAVTLLPDLLKEVNITLFSGDKDLICNHIGTEELIHNMQWNGAKGFDIGSGAWAPRRDWTFEGEAAGYYQEARNLTYIVFYNSSHMVPFDYPRRTRDMLDRFMGVDIAVIGGSPADSLIDGEKGPLTSVGEHPNSTAAKEAEQQKLEEATWHAYYKSGEVALVVVIIVVGIWAYFIWRDRRRRAGYTGLFGGASSGRVSLGGRESMRGGMGLSGFRNKASRRDVEAADFDEAELDELANDRNRERDMERDRYDIGDDESDSEGSDGHVGKKSANGVR